MVQKVRVHTGHDAGRLQMSSLSPLRSGFSDPRILTPAAEKCRHLCG
jgi:hypothetical protein